MGLSKAKMHEMVIADLGGGTGTDLTAVPLDGAVIDIELTPQAFDVAFNRAKMWFTAKKGFTVWRPLIISPNQPEYKMKDDVDNILDVVFQVPNDVSAFFSLGFFDLIPYGPQGIGNLSSSTSDYSGFAALLNYSENRKKVFSIDPDWTYYKQSKVLNLQLRSGNNLGFAMLFCKLNDFDPATLDGWDKEIFYKWLLAHCKEIVGRIRSKYDSMPTAGGTVTLDGHTLLEEAKLDKEQLDKDIFASQGVDVPMVF